MKKAMLLSGVVAVAGLSLVSCSSTPGDEHDHNPSDHGHDSTATACTNDDYNDTHGRRRLTGLL